MIGRETLKKHARLVDLMASKLGIDLEERALRGDINFDEISDAVLACTGCSHPCTCERWLAAMPVPQNDTPEYCRNRPLFKGLKNA